MESGAVSRIGTWSSFSKCSMLSDIGFLHRAHRCGLLRQDSGKSRVTTQALGKNPHRSQKRHGYKGARNTPEKPTDQNNEKNGQRVQPEAAAVGEGTYEVVLNGRDGDVRERSKQYLADPLEGGERGDRHRGNHDQ